MPEICPFLAATHDLDSVLSYPSEGNVCTRLGDALPVATGHQAGYCLRARYWFCPVYTGAIKQPPMPIAFEEAPTVEAPRPSVPLPDGENTTESKVTSTSTRLTSRPPRDRRSPLIRPREAVAALVILAAVGLGGRLLSRDSQSRAGGTPTGLLIASATPSMTPSPDISSTPSPTATVRLTATATITASATLTLAPTLTLTPTATMTDSPTSTPSATMTLTASTPKACSAPVDWGTYTIQPGETYYHIATKFGTTVEILQLVNCLADPQRVLSGQSIRVPPTMPASATASPSALAATATH